MSQRVETGLPRESWLDQGCLGFESEFGEPSVAELQEERSTVDF